jgi:hypothetical protein
MIVRRFQRIFSEPERSAVSRARRGIPLRRTPVRILEAAAKRADGQQRERLIEVRVGKILSRLDRKTLPAVANKIEYPQAFGRQWRFWSRCFDGSCAGRIYDDGSSVGTIQFRGARREPHRSAAGGDAQG